MNQNYYQLTVRDLPTEQEDEFSSLAFEAGASGISEDLAFQQPSLTYESTVVESSKRTLVVFFESPPTENVIFDLQKSFPNVHFQLSREQNKDWLEEWKKGYDSFRFSGEFWIVPSWKEPPKEAKEVLLIDPGMAFGTGTHETTQLAAELLHSLSRLPNGLKGLTVLDVGTGTGVLAMVASRLGALEVIGNDIDPECLRVARENFERNQIERTQIVETQIEDIKGLFDIVIANIIDGVLIRLRDALMKPLKQGGSLILSGILAENSADLLEQFMSTTTLQLIEKEQEGEWVALLFKRIG